MKPSTRSPTHVSRTTVGYLFALHVILLILVHTAPQVAARTGRLETWWTMANLIELPKGTFKRFPGCKNLNLVTQKQLESCDNGSAKGVSRMTVLGRASLATKLECQKQFASKRWNCPTFENGPLFGRHILYNATKESSFVHTLMAASVAHEVAKACSEDRLSGDCACKANHHERGSLHGLINATEDMSRSSGVSQWLWKDCDNDMPHGLRTARRFQSVEPSSGIWNKERQLINAHNEKLGRQLIKIGFDKAPKCKCLGFTSTCSTKVCWREVPNFRDIGNKIHALYSSATAVRLSSDGTHLVKITQFADNEYDEAPAAGDMVYADPSYSFCRDIPEMDVISTVGRVCQKNEEDPDSCSNLCCKGGYDEKTVETKTSCSCRFFWCCSVRCETCVQRHQETKCVAEKAGQSATSATAGPALSR